AIGSGTSACADVVSTSSLGNRTMEMRDKICNFPEGKMLHKFFKTAVRNGGFNLVELIIVLLMSTLILAAMTSIFTTSGSVFQKTKNISDVKEISKGGMAQLEWLFQRWGTATPCNNPDTALCTKVQDCRVNAAYPYPPPGTVCITILDDSNTDPCDEVQFYANLYGS